MPDAAQRVVIIGGGLAGLAAAAALAVRNIPAVVLESRPRLGGRASSFLDTGSDSYVDNCQHVAMGCCTNFAHFVRTIGRESMFRREKSLYFIGRRVHEFSASSLPCPFHLAGAFRRLSYLSWQDKFAIARGLKALARATDATLEDRTISQWLAEHRQPSNTIELFWTVVLVSALSESLDRISVPQARKVFVDGFLRHREGWRVDIPMAPLEELYGARLIAWLRDRGVEVRLQAGVEGLVANDGKVQSARLRDGTEVTAADFILTAPFYRIRDLVPSELAEHPVVRDVSQLESAPITSIHLWFDRPITALPHAVFVGRMSQWMFNRTALKAADANRGFSEEPRMPSAGLNETPHYYQIVISASRDLSQLSQADVLERVLAELNDVWPESGLARLVHYRLVTEHRAVFSVKPGAERLRPPQQSPIPNLQFAGDWTRTGWPATMEGAVRSGYLAVENVLRRRGRPETLLQPDLPVACWSRWLLGIT